MLALEINNGLSLKGVNAAMIAEALKVKPASVSQVISRHSDSKRIATAIAKILEKPVEDVFPDKPQYHAGYSRAAVRTSKVNELRQRLAV